MQVNKQGTIVPATLVSEEDRYDEHSNTVTIPVEVWNVIKNQSKCLINQDLRLGTLSNPAGNMPTRSQNDDIKSLCKRVEYLCRRINGKTLYEYRRNQVFNLSALRHE